MCKASERRHDIIGKGNATRKRLQEVLSSTSAASWNSTLILRDSREDAELGNEVFTNVHDGSNIATAVAVVRCGPNRDNSLLREMILCKLVRM